MLVDKASAVQSDYSHFSAAALHCFSEITLSAILGRPLPVGSFLPTAPLLFEGGELAG